MILKGEFMRKTRVDFSGLLINRNDIESISRIFKSLERSENYSTTYSYRTKKNVEFITKDFDEFIQQCSLERLIATINFALGDYADIGSDRYFTIEFNFSSSSIFNKSYYYASCDDRSKSDSFLMQIKDKLDNCEKYNPIVRFILSRYFVIPISALTGYSLVSLVINSSNISGNMKYFQLTVFVLFLLGIALTYVYPDCENRLIENWIVKIRKAIVWICLALLSGIIGVLMSGIFKS